MLYAMLSMLRFFFPMCCLARSTCFYACLHVYLSFLYVSCFMPFFPTLWSSFFSMLMLGLHAHMLGWCLWLCFAWIYVFVCFSPCFMLRSTSAHVYILRFTFFHVYVLAFTYTHTLPCPCPDLHFYMLTCSDLGFRMLICPDLHFYMLACLDLGFHMFICPDLCFHMLVCLDLCSACFMPSSMCLYTPCHVCVLRTRPCLSCHVLL